MSDAARPLRVLFVAHAFPRTVDDVAGSFLLRLAQALGEIGVEVLALVPSAAGLASRESVGGGEVRRFRYAPRRYETLAYTGAMAETARGSWGGRGALAGLLAAGARAARQAVRAWRPDVVHAHWWFPGGASVATRLARGDRPLVLTLHGSDVRLARQLRPAHALFAAVAARAVRVTAVSSWLCEEARAMAPGLGCTVAPMPVDVSHYHPPPESRPRAGVLFVGRLTPQKGVDCLLDALARCATSATLTVVGDGPERNRLHAHAERLGLTDRVRWVGNVAPGTLGDWYASAEVVAVPSTGEGLGLVAVEALLCETPVVAFRSGGIPDVVRDDVTGLLAPAGDVAAYASALGRLLADPGLGRRLGGSGRQLMESRFSPAAAATTYRAVYDAAVGAR